MTKQFGVDRAFGYRAAVDGNKRVMPAGRKIMNDLGKYFFTYTALAKYQDTQVGIGYLLRYLQRIVELRVVADNAKPVFYALYIHRLILVGNGRSSCKGSRVIFQKIKKACSGLS